MTKKDWQLDHLPQSPPAENGSDKVKGSYAYQRGAERPQKRAGYGSGRAREKLGRRFD